MPRMYQVLHKKDMQHIRDLFQCGEKRNPSFNNIVYDVILIYGGYFHRYLMLQLQQPIGMLEPSYQNAIW